MPASPLSQQRSPQAGQEPSPSPDEAGVLKGRRGQICIDREVPFSFEELFFSRTDGRGIVISGNRVFQRISMYSWDELIGRPHNLIRHPDMPRAVFWLLWDTIKKGEPIGAYVKNRAKDGRYYWVFAIVTPVEGGYLSVRYKPSALLPVVAAEYKALVEKAAADRLDPAQAAAVLLERLRQLGFADYRTFMASAASQELLARNRELKRPPDPGIARFDELLAAAKAMLDQSDAIFSAYAKNKYVPMNLSVQAARLGQAGAAIAVISNNYNNVSTQIKDHMSRFMTSVREVFKTIVDGQFLWCTAKIQQEVADFFRSESVGTEATEQELRLIDEQRQAYQRKAVEGLRAIQAQASRFAQDCDDMKRLATSLEVTRIMGKMESSQLAAAKDGLEGLIDGLESFQCSLSDGLRQMDDKNRTIWEHTERLIKITTA